MSRVGTGIGTLAVRVEGRGPTAVLWHSLYVDDRSWDRVAPSLAAERTLVRITGPGHGASEALRRPFDLAGCADAAREVLDDLGMAGPVDWVGSAWGGHVGIVLAATDPAAVRSLVAFSSPVRALRQEEARGPRLLARLLRVLGPIRIARDGVTNALLAERTRQERPELVAYVHDCLRRADRAGLANAIRSVSLRRPDLRPLLPAISAPTVLVASPGNPLWTPEQALAAADSMPDATAAVVERAGHLTPLEAPEASADLILALWSRSASAPAPPS